MNAEKTRSHPMQSSQVTRIFLVLALFLAAPWSGAAAEETAVYFLVRHAEKTADAGDPPLSEAGRTRAAQLAHVLGDAGITRIHSSDFRRTRDTATPLARRLGLEVELYDPHDLAGFAERLKDDSGHHLIVGHSNTTPALAGILGGEPGPDIDEAREYDRLYVLRTGPKGDVSTVLLRYGRPVAE